jgi:hypothetical protein
MQHLVDLTQLAAELRKRKVHVDIQDQIHACASLHSCFIDLSEARDAVRAHVPEQEAPVGDRPQTKQEVLIGQALLGRAFILYVRATHSRPVAKAGLKARNSASLKCLSPEQRANHEDIVHFRDKVLAHFGDGAERATGPWVEERLVLRIKPFGSSFDFPHSRLNWRASLVIALNDNLRTLISDIHRRIELAHKELFELFDWKGATDPVFAELSQAAVFDPSAFFFDEITANAFRNETLSATYRLSNVQPVDLGAFNSDL